jgi:hypothetical protein
LRSTAAPIERPPRPLSPGAFFDAAARFVDLDFDAAYLEFSLR